MLGFAIAGFGDYGCQRWIERKTPTDDRRTLELAGYRALVLAPLLFLYFPALERLVPGASVGRVLSRVALDTAFASPFVISLTFAITSGLRGDLGQLPTRWRQHFVDTWVLGACYWPFIHSLNFRFVAAPHQGLVAHVASVYWMAVLSYQSSRKL